MKRLEEISSFYEDHRLMHGDVFWNIAIKLLKI